MDGTIWASGVWAEGVWADNVWQESGTPTPSLYNLSGPGLGIGIGTAL